MIQNRFSFAVSVSFFNAFQLAICSMALSNLYRVMPSEPQEKLGNVSWCKTIAKHIDNKHQ